MKSQKGIAIVLGDSPQQKSHLLGVNSIQHNPDSQDIFTAGREGSVLQWSPKTVTQWDEPVTTDDRISSIAARTTSLDFDYSDDYFIELEDATIRMEHSQPRSQDYDVVEKYSIHSDWINDLKLMNHNQLLVSASLDLSIKMTNVLDSSGSTTLGVHDDYVKALSNPYKGSPSSPIIVSGGLDKQIAVWDITKQKKVTSFVNPHPRGSIYALASHNSLIASGGPDNIVALLDSRVSQDSATNLSLGIRKFTGHQDTVKALVLTEKYILSGSSDSSIKLWCLRTNKLVKNFEFHNAPVWSLCVNETDVVSGDINRFYSGDKLGNVVMSDMSYYNHPSLFEASNDGGDFDFSAINDALGIHTIVSQNNHCSGILDIHAMGDGTLWSATNNSLNHYFLPRTEALQNYQLAKNVELVKSGGDVLAVAAGNDLASLLSSDDEEVFHHPLHGAKSIRSMSLNPGMTVFGIGQITTLDQQLNNEDRSLRSGSNHNTDDEDDEEEEEEEEEEFETIFLCSMGGASTEFTTFPTGESDDDLLYGFEVDIIREPLPCPVQIFRAFNAKPFESFQALSDNALLKAIILNNRRTVMSLTNKGQVFWWDLLTFKRTKATLIKVDENDYANDDQHRHSLLIEKFDKLVSENQPSESVPQWCKVETKGGKMVISFNQNQYLDAEIYWDEFSTNYTWDGYNSETPRNGDERVSLAKIIFGSLLKPFLDKEIQLDEALRFNELTELKKDPQNVILPKTEMAPPIVDPTPTANIDKGDKKFKLFGRKKAPTPLAPVPVPAPTGTPNGNPCKSDSSENAASTKYDISKDNISTMLAEVREKYMHQDVSLEDSLLAAVEAPVIPNLPNTAKIIVQENLNGLGNSIDLFCFSAADLETRLDDPAFMKGVRDGLPRWIGEGFLMNSFPEKEQPKIGFVVREKLEAGAKKGDNLPAIDHSNVKLNATHSLRVKKLLTHITDRFESKTPEMKLNQPPEEWLEIYCNGKVLPLDMTLMTVKMTIWKSGGDMVLYYKKKSEI
ncbi:hypothetical protein BABINDRAFT_160258 [Babjeviella inositovora NRRL Y-12698]|uniref:TEP-1 C-terminal beta-propeller domain-containing protein n=1 Tax=Babjeviella inositovora NRRL Y-12698 TaxID=984486 RepID=A0A1E3QX10_9ASCO|nr:uncharacterized protein BABINDRAFT_160258 [Babjeviella inositovora NRRL Y-12698]ODQ82054.1 hypothetical protein BABINDRAFT_160258 [Babjeviella inositovora NRRL Y-12698]